MIIPFTRPRHQRVDPGILGNEIWDALQDLYIEWAAAVRMQDSISAARIEQEFRFFALVFASLDASEAVTTGRKAIVRAIYASLGEVDTLGVSAMLDAAIERDGTSARTKATGQDAD